VTRSKLPQGSEVWVKARRLHHKSITTASRIATRVLFITQGTVWHIHWIKLQLVIEWARYLVRLAQTCIL
jgi:hypothetical protein